MQTLIDIKKEYTTYIQDSFAIPIAEKINNYYDLSINEKTGLKGRNVFMHLRLILTGMDKGKELKNFLPLLDKQTLLRKFGKT